MATILTVSSAGKDSEQLKLSYIASVDTNGTVPQESSLAVSHEVKHTLTTHSPHDSAIPPLGIYPRERNTCMHTKTCTKMFTATLSQPEATIQPKCLA